MTGRTTKYEASPSTTPLQIAGGIARGADRVLTGFSAVVLILVFAYACYALWDTWRIYDDAGVDESLLIYKPSLDEGGEGLSELMALNPDVCAWLEIEGTGIDYPVVQGADNVTYLNTDVRGEFSLSGSIFLDSRNARDFTDPYSLLYGHHMEGEAMFGALDSFVEGAFFDEHRSGMLYLPDCAYEIEIFACVKTHAYDAVLFSPQSIQEGDIEELLAQVQGEAANFRDIEVSRGDRLIALSTCSDASTNGRIVVLGRLDGPVFYKEQVGGEK